MITKLRDVPEIFGDINGVDMDVDIQAKITTHPKLRKDAEDILNSADEKDKTFSLDKEYHIHKITGFGDVFDVWITNDMGEEEELAEWIFEDID